MSQRAQHLPETIRSVAAVPLTVLCILLVGAFAYIGFLDQQTNKANSKVLIETMLTSQRELQNKIDQAARGASADLQYLTRHHASLLSLVLSACSDDEELPPIPESLDIDRLHRDPNPERTGR